MTDGSNPQENKIKTGPIHWTPVWRLPVVRFFVVSLWVFTVIAVFHHRAFAPELRYTRVAEGNISQAIHTIWNNGIHGYIAILCNDTGYSGRVRPLHYLFHSVPFFLTIVRNGDLFRKDMEVPLGDRINGDLQTHVFCLFVSLVITITALSWLVWRLTGAWWSIFLLPLYAVSNVTVCENFLVNYCDSGEIAQLLFISLYLLFVVKIFSGKAPGWKAEAVGCIFLFMAYAMKETSIVLSPVMLVFLALRCFYVTDNSPEFRQFAARHAIFHGLFACILLFWVYLYRAGEYVSVNYQFQSDLWSRMEQSYRIICLGTPALPLIVVGGVFCVAAYIWARRIQCEIDDQNLMINLTGSAIVAIGIFAGFWAIDLPWSCVLVKYYLPVLVFASVAALLVQILVQQFLWRWGFYAACILWVAGSMIFMVKDVKALQEQTGLFYRNYYEYRKMVPFVAKNISENVSRIGTSSRVHIVAGQLFQEGALPFWRWLNRFHDLNIAQSGQVVSTINACERNYFRRYPGRPAVEVTMSEELPGTLDADNVYLLGDVVQNETQQMESRGYLFYMERSIGSPGIRVARYTRRQP